MKIFLLVYGKTKNKWFLDLETEYINRINKCVSFEYLVIPEVKTNARLPIDEQKLKESELFAKYINPGDWIVLLDEHGATYTSKSFSQYIEKQTNTSSKRIVFIIGGPFGFHESFLKKYSNHLALSSFTFTHEMARFLLLEQIYRAYSILKNLPYHNE